MSKREVETGASLMDRRAETLPLPLVPAMYMWESWCTGFLVTWLLVSRTYTADGRDCNLCLILMFKRSSIML